MWKKVKRILSCMLALILLLSLIDGQQFFVRAESEVKATQTEQASNKMEETETSSGTERQRDRYKGRKENQPVCQHWRCIGCCRGAGKRCQWNWFVPQ